ncbi:MAG: LPXTG cell wall anchor domain-containing protein, partial [Lachnospira sp.]|nr:LPXTG cell wall anchor domain-containing protein [Lachnospira sp.]
SANGDMNGFKLGGSNGACPTPHVVENCLAFNNGATGFTDNGNGGAIKMGNCIAVNNGMYDTTKANFMCYRTSEDAEYTNIVSAATSKNAATDQFKGKLSHVLYNYKGVGTYWVNEWTCKDGAKTKYTGSEAKDYTVALSDFVNTTIPGYNASKESYAADYHEIFRNADGSIYVNQLYELKSDSRIYEAGVNGSKIGCSFEKQVEPGKTEGNVESKGDAPKIDNAEDIAKKIEASVELTDEEKASIAAGSNISVSLVINDEVKTEEKELVEKNLSSLVENGNIGQIFDISIIKKIGDGEAVSAQVNKEVTLQIAVPEKLLNKDSNIERTYKIIRVHNGEVTVLDSDKCQFNEKTGVITFKTDKFSTYAIIYTDRAKEVISGGSEAGGKDNTDNGNNANIDVKEEPVLGSTADDSVNTGDNFNLYMYLMLLAVSGAALFLSKKKKYKNN